MTCSFRLSILTLAFCTALTLMGLSGCADALVARDVRPYDHTFQDASSWRLFVRTEPAAVEEEPPAGAAQLDPSGSRGDLSNLAPFREQRRSTAGQARIEIRRY